MTTVSDPIGQSFYLDREQCELFNVAYAPSGGELFYCSAETILRTKSQGYDTFHKDLLTPLGPKTVVATPTGHGWFKITSVVG